MIPVVAGTWRQTGKGHQIHRYDLPPLSELRILDMDDTTITLIRSGDFNGLVYTCDSGVSTLQWWQYPGELIVQRHSVASDYADSAE